MADISLVGVGFQVSAGDHVQFGDGVQVRVPDGLGTMSVWSVCGLWWGEMLVEESGGVRWLVYLKMQKPADKVGPASAIWED